MIIGISTNVKVVSILQSYAISVKIVFQITVVANMDASLTLLPSMLPQVQLIPVVVALPGRVISFSTVTFMGNGLVIEITFCKAVCS